MGMTPGSDATDSSPRPGRCRQAVRQPRPGPPRPPPPSLAYEPCQVVLISPTIPREIRLPRVSGWFRATARPRLSWTIGHDSSPEIGPPAATGQLGRTRAVDSFEPP